VDLSIIICTRNRASVLNACLASIEKALAFAKVARPSLSAEIVVVDNGSTDATGEVLRAYAAHAPYPFSVAPEPRQGLSCARNKGIAASCGDLLVFVDDDCCLDEKHLDETLRHHAQDEAPVLRGGRVERGDPTDLPLTIQPCRTKRTWRRSQGTARAEHLGGGALLGCNLSFPRKLVEQIGPFDEKLGAGTPTMSAEDTDYFYRTYRAGLRVSYVPDCLVLHFHGRKTKEEAKKIVYGYLLGAGALFAKHNLRHPSLRRILRKACAAFLPAKPELAPAPTSPPATEASPAGNNQDVSAQAFFSRREIVALQLKGAFLYLLSSLSHPLRR